MLIKLLVVILVLIFILVLVIKRFAYFRPSYEFMQPIDTYQDVREGNLHAWYRGKAVISPTEKVILFCHGNGGNISHRQDKIAEFTKMGIDVLIFDYSGFGQSRGVPNEQLCYANATMFVNYLLRKGYQQNNIIPYGESMGGAVASYVARRYNLPKVILESSIPGIKYLIKAWFPHLSLLSIIFNEFDTVAHMKGYTGASLHMHCVNDEVIPYSSIGALKSIVTKSIDMQGSHNAPIIPWGEVENFIKS